MNLFTKLGSNSSDLPNSPLYIPDIDSIYLYTTTKNNTKYV
jgi:hypothetical protein